MQHEQAEPCLESCSFDSSHSMLTMFMVQGASREESWFCLWNCTWSARYLLDREGCWSSEGVRVSPLACICGIACWYEVRFNLREKGKMRNYLLYHVAFSSGCCLYNRPQKTRISRLSLCSGSRDRKTVILWRSSFAKFLNSFLKWPWPTTSPYSWTSIWDPVPGAVGSFRSLTKRTRILR